MIKKRWVELLLLNIEKTYLYDSAIPRILSNCPSYSSSSIASRKSPNSKKIQMENFDLKKTLDQSIADVLAYKKQKMFHNINDMEDKLNSIDRNYWTIIRKQDKIIISISSTLHILK